MRKMMNDVVLDGEPKLKQVSRTDIKLADTPHIVIAVPSGGKRDNTKLHCPKGLGGCGKDWVAPGVRTPNLVPVQFMMAKENLAPPLNVSMDLVVESGRLSAEARQIMTKYAIRRKAKYILYWDDDTLPEWDALYRLHRFMEVNPEVGAVSAAFVTRQSDFEPLIYQKHGEGAWWDFPRGPGAEPQPIWGAGAGFMLARVEAIVDVMEKMTVENGGEEVPIWVDERTIPDDKTERRTTWGHDIRFCYNLNRFDWPVYVHGGVLCGHLDIESGEIYHMPLVNPKVKRADTPSVDVIVVKYNQPEYEQRTIDAVRANTEYENYNLVVHQNDSDTALSKCWNQLIEASTADYICLLNNDTVPAKGWLTKLVHASSGAGAVVPSSNAVFLSQIDVPLDRFEADFDKINSFAATLKPGTTTLPSLSGMCVLFSKSDWETIGKFDEEFKLYGEDTEFFYRMDQAGKKLVWVKDAYVHHYKAQSADQATKDGKDVTRIRYESGKLLEKKTGGKFTHGPPPVSQFEADEIPSPLGPPPGSHLRPGWTYQENPFSDDRSQTHRTDSSDRLRMLNTYGFFKDKHILDLGCNLGYFGFQLGGYASYTGIDYDEVTISKARTLRDQHERTNMAFLAGHITPKLLAHQLEGIDVVFAFSVLPWIAKAGFPIDDVLEMVKDKECYFELMYRGDAMSGGMPQITNDDEARVYLENHFQYVTKLGADANWRRRTIWRCSNSVGKPLETLSSLWSRCTLQLTDHGYVTKEYPDDRSHVALHEYQMLQRFAKYEIAPIPVALRDNKIIMTAISGSHPTTAIQVAGGHERILAALEAEGVKHQDIRPENLIDSNGRLYLLDFEWAGITEARPEGLGSVYRAPNFDNAQTFQNVIEALP